MSANVSMQPDENHPPRWLRYLFTAGACYDLWIVGMVITTLGPIVPFLMRDFALTPGMVSVIFTTRGIGYLIAVVGGGLLTDAWGRRPVVVSGALLTGVSLLISAATDRWAVVAALAAVTGTGQGLIDGAANVVMTDMHRSNPGRALNFLHVWFGVGAFCGPLAAGWLLDAGYGWQAVMASVGAAALLLALLFAPFPYPVGKPSRQVGLTESQLPLRAVGAFGRSPLFLLMAAVMFLYNGVAGSIIGWASTYLGSLYAFSTLQSSLVVSLYSAGILVGRALLGIVVERIGYGVALLVCSIGSFLSITLSVAVPAGWAAAAGFALTGLFFSGLFPTALAVGGTLFPGVMGSVSGVLVGSAALGSMVVPWATGVWADISGIRAAMIANAGLLALLALVGVRAFASLREVKRPGCTQEPAAG